MGIAAKAWIAFVLASLTGAQAIWLDNIYLTLACVIVTAAGVYLVPNTPAVTVGNPYNPSAGNVGHPTV